MNWTAHHAGVKVAEEPTPQAIEKAALAYAAASETRADFRYSKPIYIRDPIGMNRAELWPCPPKPLGYGATHNRVEW